MNLNSKLISRLVLVVIMALMYGNIKAQSQATQNDFLITHDGTKLFIKNSGSGPLCIFIHGGSGRLEFTLKPIKN